MKIYNLTRGTFLADKAVVARTMLARGFGLLGQTTLPVGSALVIDPCNSIHMFFMAFPIDVLHLTRNGTVVKILHSIKPWRIGPFVWKSKFVIELPAGTARATQTQEGDQIQLLNDPAEPRK